MCVSLHRCGSAQVGRSPCLWLVSLPHESHTRVGAKGLSPPPYPGFLVKDPCESRP